MGDKDDKTPKIFIAPIIASDVNVQIGNNNYNRNRYTLLI